MGAQLMIHVIWAMLFTHHPPDKQWLISMGLSAPLLFASGIGAGIMVPLLPLIFCTHKPPYEQMFVGMGLVLVSPLPPCLLLPLISPPISPASLVVINTHPPHKQLLMGVGARLVLLGSTTISDLAGAEWGQCIPGFSGLW